MLSIQSHRHQTLFEALCTNKREEHNSYKKQNVDRLWCHVTFFGLAAVSNNYCMPYVFRYWYTLLVALFSRDYFLRGSQAKFSHFRDFSEFAECDIIRTENRLIRTV